MILMIVCFSIVVILALNGARQDWSLFSVIVCQLIAGFGMLGLIACGVASYFYVGAQYQANIINREYGTNYTREDVFYASNVIDRIRELDRKRIELNGDILSGEKKSK